MSDQEFDGADKAREDESLDVVAEDGLTVDPAFEFEPIEDDTAEPTDTADSEEAADSDDTAEFVLDDESVPEAVETAEPTDTAEFVLDDESVPETVETAEPTDAADSDDAAEPTAEGVEVVEALAETEDTPEQTPVDIWAAVRDQPDPLTGDDVEPSEEPVVEDVLDDESVPEATQIEPVTIGSHTTTIPVISTEDVADDESALPAEEPEEPPAVGDFLANRLPEDEAPASDADQGSGAESAPAEDEAGSPEDEAIAVAAAYSDEEDDSALSSTTQQRRALMTATPPKGEPELEAAWRPRSEAEPRTAPQSTPQSLDDALFEGATVTAEVPSRTGAHWGSLIGFIVLVPIAWYLIADAGARMTLAENNPMITGVVNLAAIGELLGGLVLMALMLLLAMRSSLGPWFTGIITAICGIPWVVIPGLTAATVLPVMRFLNDFNAFGANLAHHLQASGYSGRMLTTGLALICVGIVSHSTRRRGRADEALRAEVEKVNPTGAHFTAHQRRMAKKEAGLH